MSFKDLLSIKLVFYSYRITIAYRTISEWPKDILSKEEYSSQNFLIRPFLLMTEILQNFPRQTKLLYKSIIIIISLAVFIIALTGDFPWNMWDCKFLQVTRTLPSILTDIYKNCSLDSLNSSSDFQFLHSFFQAFWDRSLRELKKYVNFFKFAPINNSLINHNPIYQLLRSRRIWHKVSF